MTKISGIDKAAVMRAYARWAPIYDATFGMIADYGRRHAVDLINKRHGRVLEVGVGTGMSLPRYKRHLKVTGIDLCPQMLDKARTRVDKHKLDHVEEILEMDAGALEFEDNSFDTVVAMYVMTVVPEPEKVLEELERVCVPGGEVILVNHFSQDHGPRAWMEKALSPFAAAIGWRPEFPLKRLMGRKNLRLIRRVALRPLGLFTMLRFAKEVTPTTETAYRHNDASSAIAAASVAKAQTSDLHL